MLTEFVHLHLHSDYSLLDGACSVKGIAELASEYAMPAVAMTDHGCMGGAIDFYKTLNSAGIKPIIGCEMYVSPTTRFDRDQFKKDIRGFHLVLLAKDFEGYTNLCKLASAAHLEGFYHKPRIDMEILAQHSKGLIALSACLKGKIASNILHDRYKDAKDALKEYLDIFGRENFYLEIMDHGMPEQRKINKSVLLLSREFDVPLVATNDVHYLKKEHYKSHELMLCIQTHSTTSDKKRFKFSSDQFYFKSGKEMAELFSDNPEAIRNTLEVAEKCNLIIPFVPDVNHYPVYEIQENISKKEYLRNICLDSMQERYGFDPRQNPQLTEEQKKLIARLDFELEVIDKENYCSYFLVVWDFLRYAREQDIAVGPGRGSGAGSIVAYLTHITDIDPIRYNLLFERFLNPERVSPPDFDIDLCERRRVEVINYVRDKYGADNVAQIGTYGTLKAKAVIKDTARALGYTFDDSNKITKLIPDGPKVSLKSAREESKELREFIEKKKWVQEIFEYAAPLEGLNRNMSIHAAGVIIGDQRLDNLVPLAKGSGAEVITQFPAGPCEELGLLKMDFLGLRTLTLIQDAVYNIKKNQNIKIDISTIPLNDKKTFDLLNKGNTVAVFQLESSGMRDLCRKFGVETIEDIIALIAIYRPGPMQFIPEFISRKMGKTPIEYDHPGEERILKETYGIMLYQEQIMQIVQVVAGFSLGQADILRRAMGKKKVDEMMAMQEKFIKGCEETNGIDKKTADAIWKQIAKFAGYGFNKSHSAAYAFIAYRTAFLKANYPVEFMAAVLSSDIDKAEKVAFGIRECREMGIDVLPPDINSSDINFTVDGRAIRFGLAAIKGVGSAAATAIINARNEHGAFKDFLSFCEIAGSAVNTRMLDGFCRTGAFDSFGLQRSQLVAMIEPTLSLAQTTVKDKASGQGSLFDMLEEEDKVGYNSVEVPDIQEFHEQEILQNEKELLGFYVTGHPLGKYADIIKIYSTHSLADVTNKDPESALAHDTGVKVGGIITSLQHKQSKKGNDFVIMQLEDLEGSCECFIFGDEYQKCKELLTENAPIYVAGLVDTENEKSEPKIIAKSITPLNLVQTLFTKELHIRMHEGSAKKEMLQDIRKLCKVHSGKTRVIFCLTCSNGEIAFVECAQEYNVNVTPDLVRGITDIIGENRLHFKSDPSVPKPQERRWENRHST